MLHIYGINGGVFCPEIIFRNLLVSTVVMGKAKYQLWSWKEDTLNYTGRDQNRSTWFRTV